MLNCSPEWKTRKPFSCYALCHLKSSFLCAHTVLLCACVSRGAGLQACPGAPEGRGLRRGPVELWKLHLSQPPRAQPLWTMRDATLRLSLILHRPPLPIPCQSSDSKNVNPPKICRICLAVFQCQSVYTVSPSHLLRKSHYPFYYSCALWPCFLLADVVLWRTAGHSTYVTCIKQEVSLAVGGSGLWEGRRDCGLSRRSYGFN